MTAYSQMSNVGYVSFNRADSPPRQRQRPDIASQFVNAGFEMLDHSQFLFQAFGSTFYVVPSHQGLRATGDGIDEPVHFAYGTDPDIIADWLLDLANSQDDGDWLTENLPANDPPEAAPGCYSLAKGIDYA